MRKDIYQAWKKDDLVQSKLKLIKDLASRSCDMGAIATELDIAESALYALRKKYKEHKVQENGNNSVLSGHTTHKYPQFYFFCHLGDDFHWKTSEWLYFYKTGL